MNELAPISHIQETGAVQTCNTCGKEKPESEFYHKPWKNQKCKQCERAYERVRKSTWYRDRNLEVQKRHKRKRKAELIAAYGGKCDCCGESAWEFLQIDHVNGGGAQHRKTLTVHMASHLKSLGYPKEGYRLLCANCNFSMGKYGYCPHSHEC